jgi:pimeloyl-ACP methyl ester carboxylesterase/DNA-binding CsgD family transcriptional regulator
MSHPDQQIRFCTSSDGVRVAYATCGSGPPLVKAANWIGRLDLDWDSPVWRPWLAALARGRTLVRYDSRGFGLSDRNAADFTFNALVDDLEAVIEAAGLDRFALFGLAAGGAIAIGYAARHPERVTHLVLYGCFTRGRVARSETPEQLEEANALIRLVQLGAGKEDSAFRQLFTSQMLPGGTTEQFRSFNELMRMSGSPAASASFMRTLHEVDLRPLAPKVKCPTLVLHPTENFRVPFEEGRALAALIPGARLAPLESSNFIVLEQEPAFNRFVMELDAFLPALAGKPGNQEDILLDGLTRREHDVLDLLARGLDNATIAAQLRISEKTVRNQVSIIFSKLGVHSRAQAVVRARDAGFGQKP